MEIISRQSYIDHIVRYFGKGMMIALTGQRRVGKRLNGYNYVCKLTSL